jgi:uncharacterized protein YjaG (DUF416 family)
MVSYDESEIGARLGMLERFNRTAFAAACAERLWPLFERYVRVTGEGDSVVMRAVLDRVWLAVQGRDAGDLSQAQAEVEAMVPTDEGEWVFEMGYGQNAAASVAYAVRTWLRHDPQEAVWAAQQVYEAADYAAQRSLADLDLNSAAAEAELFNSEIVQVALAGLAADLASAEAPAGDGWSGLRDRARLEGASWARTLP